MKKSEQAFLFKATIAKWGERAQLEMAQEECTELALAIRKYIRKQNEDTFSDLYSEVAGVEIMIAQLKLMFPNLQPGINVIKNIKLNRLKTRIDEGRFENE